MVRNAAFRLVAVALPAVGVLVGLPLAGAPFAGDPRGFFGPYFFTALPVYVAVLAAPGYLACLFEPVGARASSWLRRWWIRASLGAAALAAVAGVWGSTLMFLFGPPSLASLICAVVLWRRFERAPGPGGAALTPEGLSRARE